MKRLILILLLCSVCFGVSPSITSFNKGQVTPLLESRADLPLPMYYSSNRIMENMFGYVEGPATRRPGTRFIETTSGTITPPGYPINCTFFTPLLSAPSEPDDTALSNPTSVTNKAGLQAITGSGHYSIDADIDASGSWTVTNSFSGIIDGNNHTISNLTINEPTVDDRAMFKDLGSGAEIRNLTFENCSVIGKNKVAILAASSTSDDDVILKNLTFQNCTVLNKENKYAGIVIAYFKTPDDSYFWNITATDCTVEVEAITGQSLATGGLIGYYEAGNFDTCTFYGSSFSGGSLIGSGVGGFIGFVKGYDEKRLNAQFFDCYTATTISGINRYVGGFFGHARYCVVSNCYSTSDISVTNATTDPLAADIYAIGGFLGIMGGGVYLEDCYSEGDVNITLLSDDADGQVGGIGGFIGYINDLYTREGSRDSDTRHCHNSGDIIIQNETLVQVGAIGNFIGSLIGGKFLASRMEIYKCWADGDITLDNAIPNGLVTRVGAFAPGVSPFIGRIDLKDGNWGFDEDWYGPKIVDSYSLGSVTTLALDGQYFGGFLGSHSPDSYTTIITNCFYGSGTLNGLSANNGGFVAEDVGDNLDITSCYWDLGNAGTFDDDSDAVGKSTSEMKDIDTYINWDFSTIWAMPTTTITDANDPIRLIPFEYSTDDSYVLTMGNGFMGFFRTTE